MIEIKLRGKYGEGKIALIDERDAYIAEWHWRADKYGYAKRTFYENGKKVSRLMHNIIMPVHSPLVTDHINRNRTDNRRFNLRRVTRAENNSNTIHGSIEYPYLQCYFRKDILKWVGYKVLSKGNRQYLKSGNTREEIEARF